MINKFVLYIILIYICITKANNMTTEQIFSGISTSDLVGYRVNGDNSKELKEELERRLAIDAKSRSGKKNNTELDAKYNG